MGKIWGRKKEVQGSKIPKYLHQELFNDKEIKGELPKMWKQGHMTNDKYKGTAEACRDKMRKKKKKVIKDKKQKMF